MRKFLSFFLAFAFAFSVVGSTSVIFAEEVTDPMPAVAAEGSAEIAPGQPIPGSGDPQPVTGPAAPESEPAAPPESEAPAAAEPAPPAPGSPSDAGVLPADPGAANIPEENEALAETAAAPAANDLASVLERASQTGFCYTFWGADQEFDGHRVIAGSAQDIARLKASAKGTLIVRYKTSSATNQILFAAGKDYAANHYGALLANNVSSVKLQRVDFPDGMYANLSGTTVSEGWHTFVYSVDATDLSSKTGKTVTSFDGSSTTQYPNYASWFNFNADINDIQYLTIGGANGVPANSNNGGNFTGSIAFAAFIPETFTQAQAAQLSASDWPAPLYTNSNLSIASAADAVAIDASVLAQLAACDEMSIVVQYRNTGSGIGSLFSISDPSKVNSHFHLYQYGNTIGFEFRNNDSPKYANTCGNIQGGAVNTIAFKAENGVGYKLFANGLLGSTLSKDASSYQFLNDLAGQTAGYLGKTARSNDANSYLFAGEILSIDVYPVALPDDDLIARTAGTPVEDNRVFYNGDGTGSKFFRIPFLLSTAGDTLIAGTDANFGSTGDSAENIDCAIRVKANASGQAAMEGWGGGSVPEALHMRDYTDSTGYRQQSASYIDGVILEDSVHTNRVLLVIDAFAWNGGVFSYLNIDAAGQAHGGTNRSVAYGDGFCTIGSHKYLLLSDRNVTGSDSHGTNNINNNVTRANFNYAADVYGPKNADGRYNVYHLSGIPREYTASGTAIDDTNLSLGALSDYSLSEEYELYKNGSLLTVLQRSSDTTYTDTSVPMKVFYKDSELQLYNTSYLMQFYSDDQGATWHTDKILNGMVKPENSRYYITGPGRGIQLKNGPHAGRLLVPIYSQLSGVPGVGNPCTSVIYSDDGGVTWQPGDPLPTSLGLHESALVEMPNGSVKIFVRNTSSSGGRYITATSNDGGAHWIDVSSVFGDTGAGTNCQISAIGISTLVADPDDPSHTYPALLMTSAYNKARTNGRCWVGLVKEDGAYADGTVKYAIDWAYEHQITGGNELFAYSCMTELNNKKIGLLYETSPDSSWATGLQGMYYQEFTVGSLLEH